MKNQKFSSKNNKLKIINEKGESAFHVLCTFEATKTEKNYVLYTDYSKNENGNLNVFAATYEKDLYQSNLLPVTQKEDVDLVNRMIEKLQNTMLKDSQSI